MLIDLTLAGYGLATLGFLGLAALLALRGAPNISGRLFIAALVVQAAWATVVAAASAELAVPPALIGVAEAARLLLWILFLASLLRSGVHPGGSLAPQISRTADSALVSAGTIAAGIVGIQLFAAGDRIAFIVNVLASVLVLMYLEQVYRDTPANGRWALKFLAIALLGMFGFDLVAYSEALLYSRQNPALWTARGFANALVLPLLAIAAARNRAWKLDIAVSRDVVFHSATLLAAGTFLIVMAIGGYYVRYFGGQWGEVAQVLVIFGGLVGVLVLLVSGTVRARLRVFVAKNFFSYRYDYRSVWLDLTELLSATGTDGQPAEPLEVRALRGLGRLVESQGGALWLADDGADFVCAARWQFREATPAVSRADPLVGFLDRSQWVVSIPEWRVNPQAYGGLQMPAFLADTTEQWLIVPLLLHDNLVGFAVLTRSLAPGDVDWEVRDALKAAARQVASYLAVRRAVEALVQARQFDSFNRMSAFVVHDLKNLVAQLSLLMANAARHRDNPEFQQDVLDTVENVHGRMQGLLLQLRAGTKPIEQPRAVPVADALEAAVRSKRGLRPEPQLDIAPELRQAAVLAHRDRLERVIGHLVQNAAEATPADGLVRVRFTSDADRAVIEVQDTGKGMSERFIREQLFKPFQSTKEHGMGIGTFESREYIRELGGTLEVDSREQVGTTFRIRLPLAAATAAATTP